MVEEHMNKCKLMKQSYIIIETHDHLSNLSQSMGAIKKVSLDIKGCLVDDESLIVDLDKGLVKNQSMLKQTMARVDKMLTSASSNVLCYTLLFFFMILALLYKLTR